LGKVVERLKLTSFSDPKRSVVVEAVVDTGATMIVLPFIVHRSFVHRSSFIGQRITKNEATKNEVCA
jgi:hypothetical protein